MTTATIIEHCDVDILPTNPEPKSVPQNYNPAKYERPSVTCDIVLLTIRNKKLQFLAIKRSKQPYAGFWALPGGFASSNETVQLAAERELVEETNVKDVKLHQFGVYSEPGRDPRTWVISIGYVAIIPWDEIEKNPPVAGDDAKEVHWFDCDTHTELAFDHTKILSDAVEYVQNHAFHTSILKPLFKEIELPENIFQTYRIVLNKPIKRRKLFRQLAESCILQRVKIKNKNSYAYSVNY